MDFSRYKDILRRVILGGLILLVAAEGGAAQEESKAAYLPIRDFKGLDIKTNLLLLAPGIAVECTNWDLAVQPGCLVRRLGYGAIDSLTGTRDTNYTSIASWLADDGDKRLFVTVNSPIVIAADTENLVYDLWGYSAENAYKVSNYSNQYWYRGSTANWMEYNQVLIGANGKNRPHCWTGSAIRPLVETPPGSVDLAPVKDTLGNVIMPWNGKLDGDYYYALRVALPCSTTTKFTKFADSMNLHGMSWKIHIDSDWVVIKSPRTFLDSSKDCPDPDSVIFDICRTKAGVTPADSFYRVMRIRLGNDILPLPYWIDSIPDCSLGVSAYPFCGFIDTVSRVADTTTDSLLKFGAPVWLGTDSSTLPWLGISKYIEREDSIPWQYTRYCIMYLDTSTGMVTDTGPTLRVPVVHKGAGDSIYHDYKIRLALPSTHGCGHLWRLLCRAKEEETRVKIDYTTCIKSYLSIDFYHTYYCDFNVSTGQWSCDPPSDFYGFATINGVEYAVFNHCHDFDSLAIYNVVNQFYIVDTIKDSNLTFYGDDLDWSGLVATKPLVDYSIGWTIGQLDFPTVMNDRVYMAHNNSVYYSDQGTVATWPPGNSFNLGYATDDEITALHARNDELNIFQYRNWWKAVETSNGVHQVSLFMSGVGCVAPRSIVDLPDGGFAWLAEDGIYGFSSYLTSDYKSSSGKVGCISDPVEPFLRRWTYDDKKECCAWLDEAGQNLIFSFPTKDTSLVYALNGAGWGVWTFAPMQTTHYDIVSRETKQPMSDVLFIKDWRLTDISDSARDFLYIFGGLSGTVRTDPSFNVYMGAVKTVPTAIYKTGPLFLNPPLYGKMTAFGLWKWSNDTKPLNLTVTNQAGTLVATSTDTASYRWRYTGLNPIDALYFQLKLSVDQNIDSLAVEGLDLWYQPTGNAKEY